MACRFPADQQRLLVAVAGTSTTAGRVAVRVRLPCGRAGHRSLAHPGLGTVAAGKASQPLAVAGQANAWLNVASRRRQARSDCAAS
jgi:hypothetical protein